MAGSSSSGGRVDTAENPTLVGPVKIYLKYGNGTTCAYETNLESETVDTLKGQIHEREGIPKKNQSLRTLDGRELRDGTLLRDYGIQDGSMIDISDGRKGRKDMTLHALMCHHEPPLIKGVDVGGSSTRKVLDKVGVRILRGIMWCVVKAHKANCAFRPGEFRQEKLQVSVAIDEQNDTDLLWETASVKLNNISASIPLSDTCQEENYDQLCKVIEHVFLRKDNPELKYYYPLHVEGIHWTLKALSGIGQSSKAAIPDRSRRTQLLEALAATAEPVEMASMCWNLRRYHASLTKTKQTKFRDAVNKTKVVKWAGRVGSHPLFNDVYYYDPKAENDHKVGNTSYGNTAMDLLRFARNWFTHVPKKRWNNGTEEFQGLPHLDYIFTHHFYQYRFMPTLLLNLYEVKSFDLTEVVVPLS